jgi:hypothetical protein
MRILKEETMNPLGRPDLMEKKADPELPLEGRGLTEGKL